ncbi:hypothetical protein DPMN_133910 [Dreissena polymorpha]|uniref:Uncharacterized protein n=1 Tax=Dreissena polymorpha TaxID=45954 RepID=A0A9D4FZ64_DREPO|nr:hypothetical protein DPMN_133910 [Dreissena polymorpha]
MAVGILRYADPCSKGRLRKGIKLRCLRESCVGLIASTPILSGRGTLRTQTGTVYRVPPGSRRILPAGTGSCKAPLSCFTAVR